MRRLAAGLALLLAAAPAGAADFPGVTAQKDAKAEGYFELAPDYVKQTGHAFHGGYNAPGFGAKNVGVLVRHEAAGAFAGRYAMAVYGAEADTGVFTEKLILFVPAGEAVAIGYVAGKRTLMTVCDGDSCTVQRYLSDRPTIHFADLYATVYVTGGGERLIGLKRGPEGGCLVALGDRVTNPADQGDWDWWQASETHLTLPDGGEATLKGGDRVRCHADPAPGTGASLEFAGT
jgi:hypothetical protein